MTPQEIALAIQAFMELEPEVQKGIVALVYLMHKAKVPAPATPAKVARTAPSC